MATKPKARDRVAVRRGVEAVNRIAALPDPVVVAEPVEPKRTTIRWTTEERQAIAKRAMILRLREPKKPLYQILRQAQRFVLEQDRWRSDQSLQLSVNEFEELIKEHGEDMIGWLGRRSEIDKKLAAVEKLSRNENELFDVAARGTITEAQRQRLLAAIPADQILSHYRIDELLSSAPLEDIVSAGLRRVGKMFSQYQQRDNRLVESMERLVSILGDRHVHLDHPAKVDLPDAQLAPVVKPKLLVYGIPDSQHAAKVIHECDGRVDLDIVSHEDNNPHRITHEAHAVVVWTQMIPRVQRNMLNQRASDLKLNGKYVRVAGNVTDLLKAIRNRLPQ